MQPNVVFWSKLNLFVGLNQKLVIMIAWLYNQYLVCFYDIYYCIV